MRALVDEAFRSFRETLDEKTRWLVDRYRFEDVAMKVVGVGSVGTRCWVGLFLGRLPTDVLLLQVKEATASVLEGPLPASRFRMHGRRVVEGQRLMQAASDIFSAGAGCRRQALLRRSWDCAQDRWPLRGSWRTVAGGSPLSHGG